MNGAFRGSLKPTGIDDAVTSEPPMLTLCSAVIVAVTLMPYCCSTVGPTRHNTAARAAGSRGGGAPGSAATSTAVFRMRSGSRMYAAAGGRYGALASPEALALCVELAGGVFEVAIEPDAGTLMGALMEAELLPLLLDVAVVEEDAEADGDAEADADIESDSESEAEDVADVCRDRDFVRE